MLRQIRSFVWDLVHDTVSAALFISGAILLVIDALGEPVDLPAALYVAALVAGIVWFAFKQHVELQDTLAARSTELSEQRMEVPEARKVERFGIDLRGSGEFTDTIVRNQDTSFRVAESAAIRSKRLEIE